MTNQQMHSKICSIAHYYPSPTCFCHSCDHDHHHGVL